MTTTVLVFYAFIFHMNISYLLRSWIFFVHFIEQITTLKHTVVGFFHAFKNTSDPILLFLPFFFFLCVLHHFSLILK